MTQQIWLSSNRVKFQVDTKVSPIIAPTQFLFATNYNGVAYIWQIQVRTEQVGDTSKAVYAILKYCRGPKDKINCAIQFRIAAAHNDDGSIRNAEWKRCSIRQFAIDDNGHHFDLEFQFQLALGKDYSNDIANLSIELSFASDLFDAIEYLPKIVSSISHNVGCAKEAMLAYVLAGGKCDGCCTIVYNGGGEFHIDRRVIEKSPYFASMLSFKQHAADVGKVETILQFPDISKATIVSLITYAFTGRIVLPDDIASIKDLVNLARMMLLSSDIKDACERQLGKKLIQFKGEYILLAGDLLLFADTHAMSALKAIALSTIAKHIDQLNSSMGERKQQLFRSLAVRPKTDDGRTKKSLLDEIVELNAMCNRCQLMTM